MRTTLTLDDDVAAQLQRLREEGGIPLRQLVNEALRRGLHALDSPAREPDAPRTTSVTLGGALVPDVDDVAGTLALVEGDARH